MNGIQFRVAKSGSKLVKIPGETSHNIRAGVNPCLHNEYLGSPYSGDLNAAKATPKTAMVGGVRFHRSKNGNMYRSGIIKATRYGPPPYDPGAGAWHPNNANILSISRAGAIKKINEPCSAFSTTGNPVLSRPQDALFSEGVRLGGC